MTAWDEMARDAGYRGDEAAQVAAMLEADEHRRWLERRAEVDDDEFPLPGEEPPDPPDEV
jgi:hypothetical protein